MDDIDLDYFRTLAEEKLDAVEEELAGIGDATNPVAPDVAIGRLSRLDAMQMREMSREQTRRLETRRERLKAALQRIDQNAFGHCSNCGRPIAFARLQAEPDAMACSACVAKFS